MVGAKFDQYGAFGWPRAARSDQDHGEGQHKAGKAVDDPLHEVSVTDGGPRFLDKDQATPDRWHFSPV